MVETPSVLNTELTINVIDIKIGDASNWLVLPMDLKESICSSFDDYLILLYECVFTRI